MVVKLCVAPDLVYANTVVNVGEKLVWCFV